MDAKKSPTLEELMATYDPSPVEYDPATDGQLTDPIVGKRKKNTQSDISTGANATANTKQNLTLEEMLKNYDPTPVEYDPEQDGGEEHLVRDEHLAEKERLKSVVEKLKEKQRKDIKVRR